MSISVYVALCSGIVAVVGGDAVEFTLLRDLMRTYDPRIRPSLNSSDPLNVTFGLALAQIIDVVSDRRTTTISDIYNRKTSLEIRAIEWSKRASCSIYVAL